MGVTQNFPGFLAARFFLGVTESGFAPGVLYYLSMWYKRSEQHYRVALFFAAPTLAGAFGGIFVSYSALRLRRDAYKTSGICPRKNERYCGLGWLEVDFYHRNLSTSILGTAG